MPATSLIAEPTLALRGHVGDGSTNNEKDVLWVKAALKALGRLNPQGEVLPFIDRAMIQAISSYQRDCGLSVNGRLHPGCPTEATLQVELSRLFGARG